VIIEAEEGCKYEEAALTGGTASCIKEGRGRIV
jgi:hypothetical protein